MLTLTTTTSTQASRQTASRRAVSVMGSWRNSIGAVVRSAAKRFTVAAIRFGGSISAMAHTCTSSVDYRNTRNTRESVSFALAVSAVPATAALHT